MALQGRFHPPQLPVDYRILSGANEGGQVFDHQLPVHTGLAQELPKRLRFFMIGRVKFKAVDFKLQCT